ncbi:MAG: phosphatidate cytidylyltransferase [Gemmatimonadaceae bacterium]|nr:phosphatidate cytidylyltransferase [Gloeobacterales cyanobacterium ES-bin-141]
MLTSRIVSATVLICLALLAIYLGGWWFVAALAVLVILGQQEYFRMVYRKGHRPTAWLCLVFSLVLLVVQQAVPDLSTLVFVLSGTLICFSLLFEAEPPSIDDMATSLLGLFYAGLLPSYLVRLRALDQGVYFLLLTFACIWAADIGAFFFGKAFGKTRLSPRISPKKTVEGAIFGIGGSILVGLLGAMWMQWTAWPLTGVAFGLLIGVAGLLGDLTESLMKRDAGLKDSGELIPGHGGVMDRADSYIFTAPLAFYFISLVVLQQPLL